MRTIFIIVRKEFRQIFRNRAMLPIIFVMPVIQLLVLSNAASFEIDHLKVYVQDLDHSSVSRGLIDKIGACKNFEIENSGYNPQSAKEDLMQDHCDLILRIPQDFERDLMNEHHAQVQLEINAINGSAAAVSSGYATSIIQDYNREIAIKWMDQVTPGKLKSIQPEISFWFNPEMNYKTFMVPGILVLLITMIGFFLGGTNIVREKEMGTIEQLNVTPIKKYQFIAGKLIPFWIIAMAELAFGLILGKLIFAVPTVGSISLIFLFAGIYMLVILGMGLFVSTVTDTQQQSMFISWFFLVIFILLSGLFTPIESMPTWAQWLTRFNPITYFVEVIRLVMLKGSQFSDIRLNFFIMVGAAALMLSLATLRYRKTAG